MALETVWSCTGLLTRSLKDPTSTFARQTGQFLVLLGWCIQLLGKRRLHETLLVEVVVAGQPRALDHRVQANAAVFFALLNVDGRQLVHLSDHLEARRVLLHVLEGHHHREEDVAGPEYRVVVVEGEPHEAGQLEGDLEKVDQQIGEQENAVLLKREVREGHELEVVDRILEAVKH